MKLIKIKIARLKNDEAKSINGGGTNGNTQRNFLKFFKILNSKF